MQVCRSTEVIILSLNIRLNTVLFSASLTVDADLPLLSDLTGVQVRLVGPSKCSGRVEVYYNWTWGTVCDDNWDMNDAKVVCKEVGCDPAVGAPGQALLGEGTGPIWLNNVGCWGNESSLSACSSSEAGLQSCVHRQDAGVVCEGEPSFSRVCLNSLWVKICMFSFSVSSAGSSH